MSWAAPFPGARVLDRPGAGTEPEGEEARLPVELVVVPESIAVPSGTTCASASSTTTLAATTRTQAVTTRWRGIRAASHRASTSWRRVLANRSAIHSDSPNRRTSLAAGGSVARR
jgi:hypothetical protein